MNPGTIIIAAHNEEAVIGRTLDALSDAGEKQNIHVVVVSNGCTDRTAQIAAEYTGVKVVDIAVASKIAALREGDRHAIRGPRIYLDADVVLSSRAARDVIDALSSGAVAGRPPHAFDSSRATWIVRSWYRVRAELPSISSALWGAGCYALSETGRARFDEFPDLISDDLFIDSLYSTDEITIVPTDPVIVTTPRRTADLLRILRRSYRTQSEVAEAADGLSSGQRGQLGDLKALVRRSPNRLGDVIVYVTVIAVGRIRARTSRTKERWERDTSSRQLD
ncbi:glycosyltransferase [Salinibacterium sp. PAMC 21357]|uniref:glycosyltransferase n=1 Tax=Salinibacterium sp. PAMC 21357 TaxID=1112215 RepID=UPI000288658F|nr:glycosyltransferase [Salinibacterium sp. PAMC 21357]